MGLPNRLHHLPLNVHDVEGLLEFFTQGCGMEMVAFYWMHGMKDAYHIFLNLNGHSSVALVRDPADNETEASPEQYGMSGMSRIRGGHAARRLQRRHLVARPARLRSDRRAGVFTADEQHRAVAALAREIRKVHDRPIFCLGSSLGAYHASAASYLEEVHAVIVSASPILCDGPMVQGMAQLFGGQPVQALLNAPRIGDGLILDLDKVIDWEKNYGDVETARAIVADPNHTGQVMLKSWASMMYWKPPRPVAENTSRSSS